MPVRHGPGTIHNVFVDKPVDIIHLCCAGLEPTRNLKDGPIFLKRVVQKESFQKLAKFEGCLEFEPENIYRRNYQQKKRKVNLQTMVKENEGSKKSIRRAGGFSGALSIAADLGFSVSPTPSQGEVQKLCTDGGEEGNNLIRILAELTTVQRKIGDLEVELQGRKEDKNVAHLIHTSEMEKKIETLGRITAILKDVIQNKDRIIARLQQPYTLDYIPVEADYQRQFSELLKIAAIDYDILTASVSDIQWTQNFKEPPSMWGEMLRPIPLALASCTRFSEAISAMRESFATLQNMRVGHSTASVLTSPASSCHRESGDPDFVTPFPWKNESVFEDFSPRNLQRHEIEQSEADENSDAGSSYQLDVGRLC